MAKNKKSNATIKILAVFIAAIMWFYVMSEINPVITQEFNNIKVSLKNEEYLKQANLYILNTEEDEISVKITGRRNDILKITEGDIKAYVDLRGASDGLQRFPIEINQLGKMEIESYQPREAIFEIDEIISKEMPVKVQKSGTVANGYHTGDPIVKPESVLVRGPRKWVNTVTNVIATVDVSGLKEDVTVNVPYKVQDDKGKEVNGIEKEPDNVEITIPIYRVKNVSIDTQTEGSLINGYQITEIKTIPKAIQVMGYENDIKNVSLLSTKPIDISYLNSNYTATLELIIPDGVQAVNPTISPKVEIKVEPVIEKTFEYTIKDITSINLEKELRLDDSFSTSKLSITIKGIKSLIDDVSRRDLTLYIDLESLTEGEHEVKVNVLIGEDIEVSETSPETMKILLEKIEDSNDENDGTNGDSSDEENGSIPDDNTTEEQKSEDM